MRRVLALALLFTACSPEVRERPFSLRIAGIAPLVPLEPAAQSTFTTVVMGLVFSSVMDVQPDGSVGSRVLVDWKPAGNGRLRVTLARKLEFSDGTVARLEDLAASLRAFHLQVQEDGEALLVSSPQPGIPLEAQLTRVAFARGTGVHAVGTGPFVVESQSADRIVLRRREPRPRRVNRLEMIGYPSQRDAFAATMKGDANAMLMLGPGESELFADDTRFRVIHGSGLHEEMIVFNSRKLSRDERAALAAAVDPEELARATGDLCHPTRPRGRGRLPSSGSRLNILAPPGGNFPKIAIALKRALGELGGTIEMIEYPAMLSRMRQGHFDLALSRMLSTPFGFRAYFWRTGGLANDQGYSNPAVDAAFDAGDPAEIERALAADPPGLLVCRADSVIAIDSRVLNPTLGINGVLSTLPDWEVAP